MDKGNFTNIFESVNDISVLDVIREEVMEAYENRKNQLLKEEYKKELSKQHFGTIKEGMEIASAELFEGKGKSLLKKYVKCIRENSELSKMHLLYECIRKADKDSDIPQFLNEALSLVGTFDVRKYNEGMKKLGNIFAESYNFLDRELADSKINNINEATEFIAFNKKSAKNLTEYNSNIKIIKEYIENDRTPFVCENKKSKNPIDLIEAFNLQYSNDEGSEIVKEIFESTNKEDVFNKYKDLCINKINEAKAVLSEDAESIEKLMIIENKVNNKKYNPETIGVDIYNFIELTNCVE